MPRKAFIADLKEATSSTTIPSISDVQAGEEDGSFTFSFTPTIDETVPIKIQALVPDVSEYPSHHQYYLYTISDTVPAEISTKLAQLTDVTGGFYIHQLLSSVSTSLSETHASESHVPETQPDHGDPMETDGESPADYNDYDTDDDSLDQSVMREDVTSNQILGREDASRSMPSNGVSVSEALNHALKARICQDLRAAKDAGLKVSILGNLMRAGENGYVSVSCRISKLGISPETMKAWSLQSDQYLIFLIRYNSGYMTAERLATEDNFQIRRSVEMHVRVSSRYKPTLQQAVAVFASESSKKTLHASSSEMGQEALNTTSEGKLETIFIGRPLDQLLNDRLVILLKSRHEIGMNWAGAERYYNDVQGQSVGHSRNLRARYNVPDPPRSTLPAVVTADHVSEVEPPKTLSFPLLGMQFVFRHLVRCTEFCLVCHCKVSSTTEALKPYVCDKPLCLYQYMTLGFGPSLEYEIRSQPEVVDLLVSFCYAAARRFRLTSLPMGMGLMVPPPPNSAWFHAPPPADPTANGPTSLPATAAGTLVAYLPPTGGTGGSNTRRPASMFKIIVFRDALKVSFQELKDIAGKCPMKKGDWVAIWEPDKARTSHCRVAETAYFPEVDVNQFITAPDFQDPAAGNNMIARRSNDTSAGDEQQKGSIGLLVVYDRNFDQMSSTERFETINFLLDVLPSVSEMKSYLSRTGWAENRLYKWTDRISPALLGILRWIVASNRSSIMYVGSVDNTEAGKNTAQPIYGMEGWTQFRFAQGAPDKERRFINSVEQTTARLGLQYPSIFAWHGSLLGNWHGIIREGLHFRNKDNGRAFGNGCYHSLDYTTSAGYSHVGFTQNYEANNTFWQASTLKMTHAICLNEIVNAPDEFVSKNPHLVVSQLDWIQTRFLFVRSTTDKQHLPPRLALPQSTPEYPQDPSWRPKGVHSDPIAIPASLVSKARRNMITVSPEDKKRDAPTTQPPGARAPKRPKLVNPQVQSGLAGIGSSDQDVRMAEQASSVKDNIDDDDCYEVDRDGNRLFHDEDDTASIKTTQSDLDLLTLSDDESKKEDVDTKMTTPNPVVGKGKSPLKESEEQGNNPTGFVPGALDFTTLPIMAPPSYATPIATKTLQRELQAILKTQASQPIHELGWYIDSDQVQNMYQWIIELHTFDPTLPLTQDMVGKGLKSVVLEIRFGGEYPMSPPFVRVIRPRFKSFAQGGGGHVTAGGALCMELLTNSGWSAASNIESVLLQVRMAISSTEPFPARLEDGPKVQDYGIREAVQAYIRACKQHGWEISWDFKRMTTGIK
ncbi:MAG: hypothetical protein M1816_004210 [Peltula sp. TS41687]|nr:MAG: hypothetical protein M1816_004210 [Peltula sp. TS41687]